MGRRFGVRRPDFLEFDAVCTECAYNGMKALEYAVAPMKDRYDFSKGKRGPVKRSAPEPRGKSRITIRIDEDVLEYFLKHADASGGAAGYQTLINDALRQHAESKAPRLEDTLRRILREELRRAS